MKRQLSMLRLIIGLLLLHAQSVVLADTQILGVSPGTLRVALGQAFSSNITWRVTSDVPPASITSSAGEFRLGSVNGALLGTVSNALSSNAPDATPLSFNEALQIPADIIHSAFKYATSNQTQGMSTARIVYVRTFSDGDLPDTGVVVIHITSSAAASFNISRLALQFEDDAIEKVSETGRMLRAKTKISYTGSGVIRGAWEVASPSSTPAKPVYRQLTQVSEYFSAGREKTLISPPLPTDQVGLYRVRFRLIDPKLFDAEPSLRYFVQSRPAPREAITLLAPPHLSLLGKEVRFIWQPIAGVRAYQLELFESGLPVELPRDAASVDEPRAIDLGTDAAIPPSAGLLIPADQTSVPLTLLNRTHLQSGRTYLWRIMAIGPEGTIIGESPLQAIHVP